MATIEAVAGILQSAGRVLLQQRPPGKVYADYWEFPGGKIEPGETSAAAVRRELAEELGIQIVAMSAWLQLSHSYPHGDIRLHIFRIDQWQGEAAGREGQTVRWMSPDNPPQPLLPANTQLCKWLRLPAQCAITAAEYIGVEAALAMLPKALAGGIRLIQMRDKGLPAAARLRLADGIKAACAPYRDALWLVNDDEELAKSAGADGIHLSSRRLLATRKRPPFAWVGASCHNAQELAHCADLGLDFAVLSPVGKTLSHVTAPPLGWRAFRELVAPCGLPVYGLGGLLPADLPTAQRHHAHGIAMMRKWLD